MLLAFKCNHGFRRMGYELLVREFLHNAGKEAFKMLQLSLLLLNLGCHINHIAQRNGILVSANHEL